MQQIHGQLARDVLPEVLRHIRFLQETGRLQIWSDTNRGMVVVRDGRPVHAACRTPDGSAARGLEALATMLGWKTGHYTFEEAREDAGDLKAIGSNGRSDLAIEPATAASVTLSGDTEEVLERAKALGSPGPAAGADVRVPPNAGPSLSVPELSARSVLQRSTATDLEAVVSVSRGALELWLRTDGSVPLAALAEELELDTYRVVRRAGELVRAGLAVRTAEPLYGQDFSAALVGIVNEIMGPMGEIVVEDAMDALGLDPTAVPEDRVDELVDGLASQLQRSDWQMKLRARVARLRTEGMKR